MGQTSNHCSKLSAHSHAFFTENKNETNKIQLRLHAGSSTSKKSDQRSCPRANNKLWTDAITQSGVEGVVTQVTCIRICPTTEFTMLQPEGTEKKCSSSLRKLGSSPRIEKRCSSRQAGMQLEGIAINPAIDRSPAPELVTVRPSCLRTCFFFCLFASSVLETARVAASLDHSEETKW